MDKEKAKEFLLDDDDNGKIYISKDLQKLLDMNGNSLIGVFAVLETESGNTLMHMDWAYKGRKFDSGHRLIGEPIIMDRFLHKEFFLDANSHKDVVYI